MRRIVLLASGGLDSTTVAYSLEEEGLDVFPIFFDYGQHCVEMEWNRLNEVLPAKMRRPERFDISDIFRGSRSRLISEADLWCDRITDDDLYVPYRTMLFFALAAARAHRIEVATFLSWRHEEKLGRFEALVRFLKEASVEHVDDLRGCLSQ